MGAPQPPIDVPTATPPARGSPEWWRRTFSYITETPTAQSQYETEKQQKQQERDCRKCERDLDYLLKYSPIIRFMMQHVEHVNGKLDKSNIRCLPCNRLQTGGFSPKFGILLCQNHLRDRGHLEDTLAHELVHAYDHLRFDVDWQNLKHHACSEVYIQSAVTVVVSSAKR